MENAAELTGKFVRTVHLSYDIMVGPPESLADMKLEPAEGDRLTILTFQDRIDGEIHSFVLNEEYRKAILKGLANGLELVGADALTRLHNGRSGD